MAIHKIPRHGKAGVAFAGATFTEAMPFIISLFLAVGIGYKVGWMGYLFTPVVGFLASRAYVDWKKGRLPGHLAVVLYKRGLATFSKAFSNPKKVFIGNNRVVNPGLKAHIEEVRRTMKQAEKQHGE